MSQECRLFADRESGNRDENRHPREAVPGDFFCSKLLFLVLGIFDQDELRRWFIDRLRVRRGMPPKGRVCATYDLDPALDRLADTVRSSLDMDKIYQLLGL